jgi:hypothetical protein
MLSREKRATPMDDRGWEADEAMGSDTVGKRAMDWLEAREQQ